MPPLSNLHLVPVLQTAVGPAILISGVGLLLLTMTNRLGRVIDRARALAASAAEPDPGIEEQLSVLWARAKLLRRAILFAAASALLASLLVILLFLSVLLGVEGAWLLGTVFIASLLCLIASVVLFILDVNRLLGALGLELKPHRLPE
ncbi:MAG: DUF2721 domain-containing protein [Elusimicrobia bacterium CG_4_9_14_3_um_filter_62_55]|nr:MAG: hypothetical protein COR54_08590 [Elusimicrobia bacterium CG22_combo_CG10-13_8_21_14_all_63_91]PJA14432.1 MAG: DUF2721 domain-containing protein [Elusimicrobia bacterium CG_4_10_14_0_2_um_filter_63_34]PJB27102.1 MAG: DUF2721 domain-containing protein [Elusimicrobia bacterium CG_4_9_14_3_um_filter_62_55]